MVASVLRVGLADLAGVSSRVESVLVSLKHVKLGAVASTNTLGVAVLLVIVFRVGVRGWHSDTIEGSDAVAADLAQIDSVLEQSTEQIYSKVVLWVVLVISLEIHALVEAVGDDVGWVASGVRDDLNILAPARRLNIQVDFLIIQHDREHLGFAIGVKEASLVGEVRASTDHKCANRQYNPDCDHRPSEIFTFLISIIRFGRRHDSNLSKCCMKIF